MTFQSVLKALEKLVGKPWPRDLFSMILIIARQVEAQRIELEALKAECVRLAQEQANHWPKWRSPGDA